MSWNTTYPSLLAACATGNATNQHQAQLLLAQELIERLERTSRDHSGGIDSIGLLRHFAYRAVEIIGNGGSWWGSDGRRKAGFYLTYGTSGNGLYGPPGVNYPGGSVPQTPSGRSGPTVSASFLSEAAVLIAEVQTDVGLAYDQTRAAFVSRLQARFPAAGWL